MSFSTTTWSQPPQHQQPAYNTVTARTTLLRHMPAPVGIPMVIPSMAPLTRSPQSESTMPPASKPKKVEWTPAVRDYVARTFDPENAVAGITPAMVQAKTKEVIQYFAERNMQQEIDWSDYPLPQQLLAEERKKAMAALSDGYAHVSSPNEITNNPSSVLTSQPKKRKSQDLDDQSRLVETSIPPWRKTNLEDRITYGNGHNEKRQKKNALAGDSISKLDKADLEKRKQRFQLGKSGNKATASGSDYEAEMPTGPVVGLNENLEKPYFRLTAPPKAETVRPLRVLQKTLIHLTRKWKDESNYNYICNQFKSLRQDLTVQHIKTSFTVKVYEIHARIALEKGDTGEYNQCQTQLRALYTQNLGGHPHEFLAYRILYFVYTCNKTDMNDLLAELTPADKAHDWIRHALDVRSALALGNYHKFFKLYLEANTKTYMGVYLMDMFIERERFNALANISRAYITVTMRFLTDELAFENEVDCREFLESNGAKHLIDDIYDEKSGTRRVKVKEGAATFEALRAGAFNKIDIKGQI
ncbi:hypothetical protein K504DRAFT_370618 [Pleomassaria siparia CBS 279.74]|uniref:PCI domain-containing protein n=1 Tax=Pleomassaria siparia CBS 279.74 TaxID=1314801 RepID=A0A6G1KPG7_9PLEO|nr:hypothetical protein K504DRAFT_370618 [Pleomassaria siparia CBS 279.74]